jgi:hypothetical protein
LNADLVDTTDIDLSLLRYNRIIPVTHSQQILEGTLLRGGISVWAGDPNAGKSWISLSLAYAVDTGTNWLDHPYKRAHQGSVLYLALEDENGILTRFDDYRLIANERNLAIPETFRCLTEYQRHKRFSDLTHGSMELQYLKAYIKAHKTKLLIIDTASYVQGHGDENNANSITAVYTGLRSLFGYGLEHIVLIHHKPKGGNSGYRGSTAILGNCDALFTVDIENEDINTGKLVSRIHCTKMRGLRKPADMGVNLEYVELPYVYTADWNQRATTRFASSVDLEPNETDSLPDSQARIVNVAKSLWALDGGPFTQAQLQKAFEEDGGNANTFKSEAGFRAVVNGGHIIECGETKGSNGRTMKTYRPKPSKAEMIEKDLELFQ